MRNAFLSTFACTAAFVSTSLAQSVYTVTPAAASAPAATTPYVSAVVVSVSVAPVAANSSIPVAAASGSASGSAVTAGSANVSASGATASVPAPSVSTALAGAGSGTGSTASSSNTGNNPLIPTDVSPQCQEFLVALNSDQVMQTCTKNVLQAVQDFAPSSSTGLTASSAITQGLNQLCSPSAMDTCSDDAVKTALKSFYGNCTTELQNGNTVIKSNYDVLYVLRPLHKVLCSQDPVSGQYCARVIPQLSSQSTVDPNAVPDSGETAISVINQSATPASTPASTSISNPNATVPSPSATGVAAARPANVTTANTNAAFVNFNIQQSNQQAADLFYVVVADSDAAAQPLSKRQTVVVAGNTTTTTPSSPASNATAAQPQQPQQNATTNAAAISSGVHMPNTTTYLSTNLAFLFLSPNLPSTVLCQNCTKSILEAYVAWETVVPYAAGLGNSGILANQGSLWRGVGVSCGDGFLQDISQKANTPGFLSSGAAEGLLDAARVGLKGGLALTLATAALGAFMLV